MQYITYSVCMQGRTGVALRDRGSGFRSLFGCWLSCLNPPFSETAGDWALVQGFYLSYHNKETLLFTIEIPILGNLNEIPEEMRCKGMSMSQKIQEASSSVV